MAAILSPTVNDGQSLRSSLPEDCLQLLEEVAGVQTRLDLVDAIEQGRIKEYDQLSYSEKKALEARYHAIPEFLPKPPWDKDLTEGEGRDQARMALNDRDADYVISLDGKYAGADKGGKGRAVLATLAGTGSEQGTLIMNLPLTGIRMDSLPSRYAEFGSQWRHSTKGVNCNIGSMFSFVDLHHDTTHGTGTLIAGPNCAKCWPVFPNTRHNIDVLRRSYKKKDESISRLAFALPELEGGIVIVQKPGQTLSLPPGWLHSTLTPNPVVLVSIDLSFTGHFSNFIDCLPASLEGGELNLWEDLCLGMKSVIDERNPETRERVLSSLEEAEHFLLDKVPEAFKQKVANLWSQLRR